MIELAAIFLGAWLVIVATYKVGKGAGRAEGFISALTMMAPERRKQEQERRERAPWN